MAEIRLDVDLGFAPETVWRALTDRDVLDRWFLPGGWALARGAVFALRPDPDSGLTGPIDVEVLDCVPERRLAMQWTGPTLHTEMTWSLLSAPTGCRLSVVQTGFLGTPQSVRARELRAAYWEMFGRQLPALLSGQVTGYGVRAGRPAARGVGSRAAGRLRAAAGGAGVRLRRLGGRVSRSGSVLAVLAVAAAAALWVFLHPYGEPTLTPAPVPGSSLNPFGVNGLPPTLAQAAQNGPGAAPGATPSTAAGAAAPGLPSSNLAGALGNGATTGPAGAGNGTGAGTGTGTGSGTGSGSGTGGGAAPAPAANNAQITGAYRTTAVHGQGNYLGEISLTATGTGTASGWTAVITLPSGATVNNVSGAAVAQDGTTVTFTPDGDAQISAGGTPVYVDFKVLKPAGTTQPLSCTVNGQACG